MEDSSDAYAHPYRENDENNGAAGYWRSASEEWLLRYHAHRHMAASDSSSNPVDYTVLSVFVMTLGLILVVELIRHRLDVSANGRPFFKTVLEGVYRELATLGIVEFCIFILHKYYENLNLEQEQVFADVHFTLFYTALLNALQSVLLAFFTSRVSNHLWIRTEQLELDHYVEIREEFDRVHAILYPKESENGESTSGARGSLWGTSPNEESTSYFTVLDFWNFHTLKTLCERILRFLRYPHLYRKHSDLLIQVRFHELRVHFLRANDLPLKLKVSDYLKRSELHVLTKLVHITTFAWLLLLGGVNLIYFLMGIVVYVTEDIRKVGTSMTAIFLGLNILFVLVSIVIFNKMKRIFGQIMHMKLIAQDTNAGNVQIGSTALSESERIISSQLALFWGNDPRYVTSLIQFMQFGFAMALALLLVFWDDIDTDDANVVSANILITVVFCCYFCFVVIMAHVIPRFTLCTSLGQLVNHRRLHETLARFRLEEAQRKRMEEMEEITLDADWFDWEGSEEDEEESPDLPDTSTPPMSPTAGASGPLVAMRKTLRDSVMGKPKKVGSKTYEDIDVRHSHRSSVHADLMAKMVTEGTGSLRTALEEKQPELKSREERMRERRSMRKKAMSEGVATMRSMPTTSRMEGTSLTTTMQQPISVPASGSVASDARAARRRRMKSHSASESIQQMRDATMKQSAAGRTRTSLGPLLEGRPTRESHHARQKSLSNPKLLADMVMMDTKELRKSLQMEESLSFGSAQERRQVRHRKRKSLSDGVSLMRSVGMSGAAAEALEKTDHVEESDFSSPIAKTSYHERRKSLSDSARMRRMRSGRSTPTDESSLTTDTRDRRKPDMPFQAAPLEVTTASTSVGPLNGEPLSTSRSFEVHDDGEELPDHFASNASDAGHSDVDDIPDVDPSFKERQMAEPEPLPTIPEIAREYFLSRKYQMISAVFGTMICFFVVGQRVETLLLETYILPDAENTFHFNLKVLFWLETSLLLSFIIISSMVILLFGPLRHTNYRYRCRFLAGIFDVVICGGCLAFLMVAESKRCCDDNKRFLAPETDGEEEFGEIECCPDFGSRAYGGLGNIEPFTSLVALRVCRFYVSKKIVLYLGSRLGQSAALPTGAQTERLDTHPFHPAFDQKGHVDAHKTKSMEDERGTVVELWKHALGLYPDVVEKYGEFSSELLQAMLGIDIVEQKEKAAPDDKAKLPLSPKMSEDETEKAMSPETKEGRREVKEESRRGAFKVDKRYSTLPPDAQSIILSGKLGRPVKSQKQVGFDTTGERPPGLQQLTEARSVKEFKDHAEPAFEFGIDEAVSDTSDPLLALVAPNSRLLRSMRRCDRRLPPLLDKWTAVDVVMTKHELVYFEVDDIDDFERSDRSPDEIAQIKAVQQAVIATRGGKGLRLRDVAVGRKVVGHLAISAIDSICVERVLPQEDGDNSEDLDMSGPVLTEVQDELWNPCDRASRSSRASRWKRLKEDRLKVHAHHHGTLYLRFFSDLYDSETNRDRCLNEREEDGPLFKNNALQWCQTIVRLCGADQLKQKFPHYGDDNADELRDYIVIVEIDEVENAQGMMKMIKNKIHHRRASTSNLLALATEAASPPTNKTPKPSAYRRSSSADDSGAIPKSRSAIFHRSSSTGDNESRHDGDKKGPDMV